MNDLDRILSSGYEPSDGTRLLFLILLCVLYSQLMAEDVMRARLRTMGVQEHRFRFETGTSLPQV